MIIRYSLTDKPSVIDLLKKNTPEYFDISEENDFENYLENEIEDYYVFEENYVRAPRLDGSSDSGILRNDVSLKLKL